MIYYMKDLVAPRISETAPDREQWPGHRHQEAASSPIPQHVKVSITRNESVINGIDMLRKDLRACRTSVAALDCEQLRGQRQKRRGSLPSRSRYGRRSFPRAPSEPATRPAEETNNQCPPPHGTARQRSTHRSRTSGRNLGKQTGSTTK